MFISYLQPPSQAAGRSLFDQRNKQFREKQTGNWCWAWNMSLYCWTDAVLTFMCTCWSLSGVSLVMRRLICVWFWRAKVINTKGWSQKHKPFKDAEIMRVKQSDYTHLSWSCVHSPAVFFPAVRPSPRLCPSETAHPQLPYPTQPENIYVLRYRGSSHVVLNIKMWIKTKTFCLHWGWLGFFVGEETSCASKDWFVWENRDKKETGEFMTRRKKNNAQLKLNESDWVWNNKQTRVLRR